ncbi:uncharacterized protein LOC105214438 isoform X2 [Zeugodacus cucurbitae]|uniref:uncharacterized protein LOC105214438 isoform X2 n=1 Tax=Zeugodacus cucurbitae TaxID=28588 RepID=UPI0023D8E913|nr:uncharacterized protein LOC105214438 isoform X2 [Zeugodacus cucurbitae]
MFLLILFACIATCRADLLALSPDDFQQAGDIKIATIVHNTPSAVSHTTFTRVHNPHGSGSQLGQTTQPQLASTAATQTAVHQPKPSVVVQPVYTTQQLSVYPTTVIKHDLPKAQLVENIASPAAAVAGGTPVVNSLTHTPAHLAYSARPIVYQMLPEIKPVRAISFEESVPSPRNKHYYRTQ